MAELDAVTGAFSFTGRFIARRLLADGRRVRTLTNHPRTTGSDAMDMEVVPLQFTDRDALIESLRGVDVLYNTYWIRFPHSGTGFGDAIANTRRLMGAAAAAGVRKVVHISVSNPSFDSPLDYYAGKARAETVVHESGMQWAVVRPTLIFGPGDILINNIAWLLRRVPVFFIPGHGTYRLQPVAGEDVARIAVWAAGEAARVLGRYVKDVMLTSQELAGLMDEHLVSSEPPRGRVRVEDWLLRAADGLGMTYASELDRHFRVLKSGFGPGSRVQL